LTVLVKKETDTHSHRGLQRRMEKAKDFKKAQKDHNQIEISGMKKQETLDSEKIERLRIPTALMLI